MHMHTLRNILKESGLAISVILITAITLALGFGVIQGYGYLMWMFSLPVLFYAINRSWWLSYLISFTAVFSGYFLISYYEYQIIPTFLHSHLPKFIILQSLAVDSAIFAVAILITRYLMLRFEHWSSIFILPIIWTIYEYFISIFSPAGTNGLLSYTQIDWTALIQIVSITGVWSITFLLLLVPSTIVYAWRYWQHRRSRNLALGITFGLLLMTLVIGGVRLSNSTSEAKIKVGVVSLPADLTMLRNNSEAQVSKYTSLYINKIDRLAKQGAKVILIPEKMITIKPACASTIIKKFSDAARNNKIMLIIGFKEPAATGSFRGRNAAYVFNQQGVAINKYYKQYLVVFSTEKNYKPGNKLGLFNINSHKAGVAICHDLDFSQLIRNYSRARVGMLFVPAFDYFADGWLHGRIAIMHGVAGNFAVVRAGQWGYLSISDTHGRVISIADSTSLKSAAKIIGVVSFGSGDSFYARTGDWFVWACIGLLAMIMILYLSLARGRKYVLHPKN